MRVFLIGSFLWLISLIAAFRLLAAFKGLWRAKTAFFILAVVFSVAAAVFFRPHEDIFGGEDPGAYINAGVSFGRKADFFYIDNILSLVSPDLRPLFYYGHAGYGPTKDACLWVVNEPQALIGPRFQPAYPLLIAVLTHWFGNPDLALYVVPFFTILTGLALSVLALNFLPAGRWGAPLAFWLFLLNPLTLWHGRVSRPEIIAAYMLFGGIALLWKSFKAGRPSMDVWIGSVCLCLAPFFHVTAWYALIPTSLTVLILIVRGQRFLLPFCLVSVFALYALRYQTAYITNYYALDQMLFAALGNLRVWVIGCVFFLILLLLNRLANNLLQKDRLRFGSKLAGVFGLLSGAVFVYYYFNRDMLGSLPFLGRPVEHYFYLTDFQVLVNMLSMPVACLALSAWILWTTKLFDAPEDLSQKRLARFLLALVMMPAVLFAGQMRDFMMTRYLMVAIIPLLSLLLTGLIIAPAVRFGKLAANSRFKHTWQSLITAVLLVLFLGLSLKGRTHLGVLREYAGLTGFLKSFADKAKFGQTTQSVLLVEYSRLAAPLEHYFGFPVLGIDNERRDDYSAIEAEWKRLVSLFPDVPLFFLTPFHPPVSDSFVFTHLHSDILKYQQLRQAGRSLPREIRNNELKFSLYRMHLSDKTPAQPKDFSRPYLLPLNDQGNMGLRRFSRQRSSQWRRKQIDFHLLHKYLPQKPDLNEILLITEPVPSPLLMGDVLQLDESFNVFRGGLNVFKSISEPLAVFECFLWGENNKLQDLADILPADLRLPAKHISLNARWIRSQAACLLPHPPGGKGKILFLLRAPPAGTHFRVTSGKEVLLATDLKGMEWCWRIADFKRKSTEAEFSWIALNSEPAWNSKISGYPSDLGVLVGMIAVLP